MDSTGKPPGTYTAPTIMGVGLVVVDAALFFVAAATAIVRPAIALWVLGLVVVLGAAGVAWTATDGTAPSGNAIVASAVGPTLPAFTAALLIRSTYFKTS